MSLTTFYSSNAIVRATLKTAVVVLSSSAAVFFVSAGYGLLKVLLSAMIDGASIGIAELATHSSLTVVFFVLAGTGAYVAKKCL